MRLAEAAPLFQGLGVVLAALVGVGLWSLKERSARLRDEAARRRRLAEVMVAFRAEVLVTIERTALQFDPAVSGTFRALLLHELRSRPDEPPDEKRDMPQGVADEANFVFDALRDDLGILPQAVVEPIVRHYRYDRMLSALIRAFAAGAYERVNDARQAQAVTSLFWLGEDSLFAALRAVEAVDAYLSSLQLAGFAASARYGGPETALMQRLAAARRNRYLPPAPAQDGSDEGDDRSGHDALSYPDAAYIVEMLRNGN